MKKILYSAITLIFIMSVFSASALTKPGPDANVDNLSYAFYLYYDNGQLFADRDYEVKYDVVEEAFTSESSGGTGIYRGEIINLKSEIAKTFAFDPQKSNPGFTVGKILVKGPYVSDGMKAQFYNDQGELSVSMFVNAASICNDDGSCNSAAGENEKSCPSDCKRPRATPIPQVPEQTSSLLGDFDWVTISIYAAGGVGVAVGAWFGWKWWKKRKEENFQIPPPSAPPSSMSPLPPIPPSFPN